ncbi:MAG TPA: XVIPCD domain-containing protein [Dyella sp.]|nr:XVIPCD domain-containing protein [Dyella sp.]
MLDAVDSTSSGFQGVALRSATTGDIEISFRGTELGTDWGRDAVTDAGMVKRLVNNQLGDADKFFRRVAGTARSETLSTGLPIQISVTGHSLGGTHAEVIAYRYKLPGEAFNGYGSVGLAYGVPEGQPQDAPPFINHVKATDIVSAASRHYGTVVGYATKQDVAALRAGRYLDTPDPRHPPNPMITGQISAHFITNFAPEASKGESILTAANEARYEQYRPAFEHFRHDVLTSRVALHDLLNNRDPLANKAYLGAQLGDAVDVTRYKLAVRSLEYVTGASDLKPRMDAIGDMTQWAGKAARHQTEAAAARISASGDAARDATSATSLALVKTAVAWHRVTDEAANTATPMQAAAPLASSATHYGAKAAGVMGEMTVLRMAAEVDAAGSLVHRASAWMSQGLHDAGTTFRDGTAWAARTWHDTGALAQRTVDAAASTRAHDAVRDALARTSRLDQAEHPDHPMFQQAWQRMRRIDAAHGRQPDHRTANVSGALVAACKAQGMTRIDSVVLSADGSRAFASEQVIGRTMQRHAVVDTAQAVRTPLEQSSLQAACMPAPAAGVAAATPSRQHSAAMPLQQ